MGNKTIEINAKEKKSGSSSPKMAETRLWSKTEMTIDKNNKAVAIGSIFKVFFMHSIIQAFSG